MSLGDVILSHPIIPFLTCSAIFLACVFWIGFYFWKEYKRAHKRHIKTMEEFANCWRIREMILTHFKHDKSYAHIIKMYQEKNAQDEQMHERMRRELREKNEDK